MAYTIDKDLEEGIRLIEEGKKIDVGLTLINKSARKGTTKGKSLFQVGMLLREGIQGLEPNVEESRAYFDGAYTQFFRTERDSMDNRELGDYFYYGLGTQPANKMKALEFYDLAAEDGDEKAKAKADEIRASIAAVEPKESLPEETEEVAEEAEAEPVVNQNKPVDAEDEAVHAIIDADKLLIKAIRLIDSSTSTDQDRLDGVEIAKTACEAGSLRAAVLLGYLNEGNNELVERNLNVAKSYYDLAISRGSCSAEYRLGRLYLDSEAEFADEEAGQKLILDSARRGYSYALNYLGDCFRAKVSDPANLDLAYRYYALAGERGLGLGYHNMAEIDASRQNVDLAKEHEKYATKNGYDAQTGVQDPLFCSLHI